MVAPPLLQMPVWDMTWLTPAWGNVGTLSANANVNFMAIDQRLKVIEGRLGSSGMPLHVVSDGQLLDHENRLKVLETGSASGVVITKGVMTITGTPSPEHDISVLVGMVKTLTQTVAQLQRDLADRPSSGVAPW